MGPVRDLQENFDVVAGSGEECTPGERDICGDGKPALTARFLHPKGRFYFLQPIQSISEIFLKNFLSCNKKKTLGEGGLFRTILFFI